MAMTGGPNPLERAVRALQDEPDAEWPAVAARVKGHVRGLVRPAPRVRSGPADPDGSRTWVSTRVLVALVRDLARDASVVAHDVDVEVVDDRCEAVEVDLVCAYGVDLPDVGARVRADLRALLHDVLGPAPVDVRVSVVDVVVGDPRLA